MKYWVYLDGEVPGSYAPAELAALPGFAQTSMVCPVEGPTEARNWRRAGEFSDILDAMQSRRLAERPAAVDPAPEAVRPLSVDDVLNDASSKLFLHVADLMRELENRREERALTQALQRQVAELRGELLAARERIARLDERAALLPGFEDRERMLQAEIARARSELRERGAELIALREELAKARLQLEEALRRAEGAESAASRHEKVAEELSAQLAEKELSLAKAYGIVRRLEQTLCDIVPSATAGISREVPDLSLPAEEALGAPEEAAAPDAPPAEAPPETPAPPEGDPRTVLESDPVPESHLPPEGEVRPVPRPWRTLLKKAFENISSKDDPPETKH